MKTIATVLIIAATTAPVTASVFMGNSDYFSMSSMMSFDVTGTGLMFYTEDDAG